MTTFCFRCDADEALGYGHLARCLTLAEEVRRRGGNPVFALRPQDETAQARVAAHDFPILIAAAEESWPMGIAVLDLAHREAMAHPKDCDALLVRLRQSGHLTVWLDSMGEDAAAKRLTQSCDIIVSPYLGAEQGVVPRTPRWLAGADYAVLPPGYSVALPLRPSETQRQLLVTLGGSDPWRLSEQVLAALDSQTHPGWRLRLMAGPFFDAARVEALRRSFPWADIADAKPDLLEDYRESDAVVTAAGLTRYEIAALGLPGLLISPDDFCRDYLLQFQQRGLAQVVFATDSDFATHLPTSLAALHQHERSAQDRRLVDGLGCPRIIDTLLQVAAP